MNNPEQTNTSGLVQKQKTDEIREIQTVRTDESLTDSVPVATAEPLVTTTTETRSLRTEEPLNPVQIEQQDTQRLRERADEMLAKLEARYSMPVEQPVPQPDGRKVQRERNARIRKAKARTPAGDEYTTVFMDAAKQREKILDMSTPDVEMQWYMDRAKANGIDERQLRTFMQKVTTNKSGRPDREEQAKVKRANLMFIEDFSSGDRQRITPHLDRITEEILHYNFSEDMFEPERMAQNAQQLMEMSQYITSFQDLRTQFPWYFESQPAFRKAMLDNLYEISAIFTTHFQNVMATHAYDYAHKVALKDTRPVAALTQMSEEMFKDKLKDFTENRKKAMSDEADRLARIPVEEANVEKAQQIGEGAYKYGVPSVEQILEIIKKQSDLTDIELNTLVESQSLNDLMDHASLFHTLINNIGSSSDKWFFTKLIAAQRGFIDSCAALSASLKESKSEIQRRIAGTLGFMAMKTMSYSAVLVNLESEFRYNVAMGDTRSLKIQMTNSGLGANYEGSHKREQYRTVTTDLDGLQLPVLSQNLRNEAGNEIADDPDYAAIVMTVEAYEDFLRSAQVPPCETVEERNKYKERLEAVLGELLAFNDRITARAFGYLQKYAVGSSEVKKNLCKTLEKYVLGRDIEDNNFERVAELAYRLRHNSFTDTDFNAAYTGKSIMEALQNTGIATAELESSKYKKTGGAVSKVYIPKDTQSENAVYRLGSTYRNWYAEDGKYDIDETKGRISSFKTTAGKMVDIRKSSRDVAVARVDKLLGSGVIADASHVNISVDGGTRTIGSRMALGKGKEVYDYSQRNFFGRIVKSNIDFYGSTVPEGEENTQINLSAPASMEKVYWLQVVDIICGSADRHIGNFFVETDRHGAIKSLAGIDNDMAFGETFMPMKTDLDRMKMFGNVIDFFPIYSPVLDQAFPCIPSAIYDKVMSLTPETLSMELRGSIRDSELQTAILRLKALQEHFQHIPRYDLSNPKQAAQCADTTKETANKLAQQYNYENIRTERFITGNYFVMMMKR